MNAGPNATRGARRGINDYAGWFARDKEVRAQLASDSSFQPGGAPGARIVVAFRIERKPADVDWWLGECQRRHEELVAPECVHGERLPDASSA